MKLRIFAMIFILLISASILISCANEQQPIEDPTEDQEENPGEELIEEEEKIVYTETEVGTNNTLSSLGESITLDVIDSKLYITNLSTKASGVNLVAENSEYLLPQYGKIEKKRVTLAWEFVSAIKFEGKYIDGVLSEGLIYTFNEPTQNLELKVYCVIRPELSGAFEFHSELKNLNNTDYRIEPMDFASVSVNIPDVENTNVVRMKKEGFVAEGIPKDGAHTIGFPDDIIFQGTGLYVENIAAGKIKPSEAPNFYQNGHWYMAQFIDRNSTDGVFVAFEWTTGRLWSKFNGKAKTDIKISLNNDDNFSTLLSPEEIFIFPDVYIMPYDGDVDNGSNLFKNWFMGCQAYQKVREGEISSMLLQTGCDIDPDYILGLGFDAICWDYGWWWNSHTGKDIYEGSWELRHPGYLSYLKGLGCENMADYGKLLDSKGINWVLYVLLHDTVDENGQVTDKYGEFNSLTHPEWFTNQRLVEADGYPYVADLGNEECVDYIKNTLQELFTTNNVKTWRTDFEPIAVKSDKENRHDANGSDVSYWCTVGFTEIVEHLYDTVKGFRLESCNSGGGNKDLYMATKATYINLDDTANYLSLRTTFYTTSYIIHPSLIKFPISINRSNPDNGDFYPKIEAPKVEEGDTYDFRDEMIKMSFRTGCLAVPDSGVAVEDSYYIEYTSLYKSKIAPFVKNGELYHILPRPDGKNWDGMMYADPDSENDLKGVVFLFKPSAEVSDTQNVVLDGLYADTVYQLTFEDRPEQNCTATGSELMTKGIDVNIKYIGSELIWITEAE